MAWRHFFKSTFTCYIFLKQPSREGRRLTVGERCTILNIWCLDKNIEKGDDLVLCPAITPWFAHLTNGIKPWFKQHLLQKWTMQVSSRAFKGTRRYLIACKYKRSKRKRKGKKGHFRKLKRDLGWYLLFCRNFPVLCGPIHFFFYRKLSQRLIEPLKNR